MRRFMEKVTQADLSYALGIAPSITINTYSPTLFFINKHVSVCNARTMLSLRNGKLCQPQHMHKIFHCTPVYNTGLVNGSHYANILINLKFLLFI
jgi:hypothetical protein